jgi:phosphate transport system permease protein
MTTQVIPKPSKPWEVTVKQRAATGSLIALAVVLAGVSVKFSGLNGKLGFAVSFFFIATGLIFVQQLRLRDLQAAKDALLSSFAMLGIVLTLIPIVSIVSTVVIKGYKGIHPSLLFKDMALNSVNDPITEGGLLHALVGTSIMVFGALIISFPIGVLTALYLTEIRGKLARPIKFLVQAMSGVPSIVAGLFILSSLVYPVTKELSGLMGSFALSILMIPTIARTAEEMLRLIPSDLREAGVALGATQWRTVSGVVLPAAKSGLVTAIILGVARIIGETAPLLLVSGGGDALNMNPTSGAMGSLPYYIWKSFLTGGTEEAFARAWGGMLVLLAFIFILFGLARFLSGRKVG